MKGLPGTIFAIPQVLDGPYRRDLERDDFTSAPRPGEIASATWGSRWPSSLASCGVANGDAEMYLPRRA